MIQLAKEKSAQIFRRYLLILVRLLSLEEVTKLGFKKGINFIKIITARDMNKNQRKMYDKKKGIIQ